MSESLPLAAIHAAILEFIGDRDDVVLFGAQAVNAYVSEPRMTPAVDLISNRAAELAEEIKTFLHDKFHAAIRTREVALGRGYRIYQVQKDGNRHLVDVRQEPILPKARKIEKIWVIAPVELIAYKVIACRQRKGQPKSGTDWRDLALLLLRFPELKRTDGVVSECLLALKAEPSVLEAWREWVALEIQPPNEDDAF